MKSITVKLDEATLRQLREVAKAKGIRNQSELVRRALKAYLVREALHAREEAIAAYAADPEARREAAELAETGIGDLQEHLDQLGDRDE